MNKTIKPFITFLLFTLFASQSNAYEVYVHNQGNESVRVNQSKVMNAKHITFNVSDASINLNDDFIEFRSIYSDQKDDEGRSKGIWCKFLGKATTFQVTPTSINMIDNLLGHFVSIQYSIINGKKNYTIHISDAEKGTTLTIQGRPTFFTEEYGKLLGSETTTGRIPVLLDWLENFAKKSKSEIQYLSE